MAERTTNDRSQWWFDGVQVQTGTSDEGNLAEVIHVRNYVWDPVGLTWARETQPGGAGGGGGGPATIADGADVAQGSTTDTSAANTVVGVLKNIKAALAGTLTVATHAVTQSGAWTVTANAGTNLNTSALALDATLTGGTQKTKIVDTAGTNVAVVSAANALKVDGSAVTQPVSGTFFQATQPVSGTFFQATQPVSLATNTPDVTDRAARLLGVVDKGKVWDGTNIVAVKAASGLAVATDPAFVVQQAPQRADASTLMVTTLSAANTTVTLTLPAPAAGLFHYITSIEILAFNPTVTAIAAAATTLSFTTTNLPGSPVWNAGTLLAAGAEKLITRLTPTTPLKSSVAATATTFVAPAIGTGALCRLSASYYTAP